MHAHLNEQGALEGNVDYLPIQAWFMKKKILARNHFNLSFLIRVQEKIDKPKLREALEKLNKLHDMFRAEYHAGKQSYRKESSIPEIKELDIRGKKAEAIFQELTSWQSRFDIEKGYVWQVGIIRGYEDGSERIYFAAHHLVTDAASWCVICQDLKALYEGKEIAVKGSSYRQWVDAVKKYGIHAAEKEKHFWQKFKTEDEQHLQTWEKFAEIDDSEIRATRIDFSEDTIQKLLQLRIAIESSEIGELLLSGLGYALYEVNGSKSNWITIERQGREEIDSRIDVRRTVGWFTTMYPFCLTVEDTMRTTILANKEKLRNVPCNGIGYGAIHGYDKLPKVLFNFIERLDGTTENNWQIRIKEVSGESMSPENRFGNIVDINGLSVEGRMGLWFESCLKEEHHKKLCEAFKRNVEALMVD